VNEERNVTTTNLQLDPSGCVPYPARIGIEDVAELAVAAALFPRDDGKDPQSSAFHYTLACRWVSEQMDPYPAQGKMCHGHSDATTCMVSALKWLRKQEKRKQRQELVLQNNLVSHQARRRRRSQNKMKPYGICVAIPVYLFLTMVARSLWSHAIPCIPGAATCLGRLSELGATAFAYVVGGLTALLHGQFHPSHGSWKWLIPRRYRAKYISF
jgi:hypothetical protein